MTDAAELSKDIYSLTRYAERVLDHAPENNSTLRKISKSDDISYGQEDTQYSIRLTLRLALYLFQIKDVSHWKFALTLQRRKTEINFFIAHDNPEISICLDAHMKLIWRELCDISDLALHMEKTRQWPKLVSIGGYTRLAPCRK